MGQRYFTPRKGCTTDKFDFRETWRMQSHQRRIFLDDETSTGWNIYNPVPYPDHQKSIQEKIFIFLELFFLVNNIKEVIYQYNQ